MKDLVFLDSNVLLYAANANPEEREKRRRAIVLIEGGPFAVSGQVLAEFYTIATNARRRCLTHDEALAWVQRLGDVPCAPVDVDLVSEGIRISHRYKISYWDGAIIAAAERLGADMLYTEDLNDGQVYGSVTVRNPFL